MLSEGMIKISPDEKSAIKNYFSRLSVHINKLFIGEEGRTKSIEANDLINSLNLYSDKINTFDVKIKYIFAYNTLLNASYDHVNNEIVINIINASNYSRDRNGYYIFKIKKEELLISFYHEFIHYKQSNLRIDKSGDYTLPSDWNNKDKYWTQPWENQAWAVQYVEYLKNKMNIKNPSSILSQLKKMGVIHDPSLNRLKKENLHAWKRIMKNAIIYAIQASQ